MSELIYSVRTYMSVLAVLIGCSDISQEGGEVFSEVEATCSGEIQVGYCFRKVPSPSTSCTPLFEVIDDRYGCQSIEVGRSAVQFLKDCSVDADCVDSEFGPFCSKGLCSHWGMCSTSVDCSSQTVVLGCHEMGVCALGSE